MSPAPLSGSHSADLSDRHSELRPENPDQSTPLPSSIKAIPIRHYASLQEHADQVRGEKASPSDFGLTPRPDGRREGFSWDVRPVEQDQHWSNRNTLPPDYTVETPPPLEELLRRHANEDADSIQNARLREADTWGVQLPVANAARSSTSSDSLSRTDTTRSSIAGSAQSMVRRIPDMRMFTPPEQVTEQGSVHKRRDSLGGIFLANARGNKQERKLSFILPQTLKQTSESKKLEEPSAATSQLKIKSEKVPCGQRTPGGSLRDRRKVKLDLALPVDRIEELSSITPSRPRSPKTPWIRDEPPKWHHETLSKTAPILEEGYMGIIDTGNEPTVPTGLLPGNDIIYSSQSPGIERSTQKARDRCYLSRPRFRRSRSGRSGTSESTLAQTPDSNWVSDQGKARQEQHARTELELRQLGQTSKSTHGRRCRWTRPWNSETRSSDEMLQSPLPTGRRLSLNPFKRSARISDQNTTKKDDRQSPPLRFWWARKHSITDEPPPMPLSNMPVPPAFVPPGLNRVPTPTSFDPNGDIKGKLADFFFDHGTGVGRRKPKTGIPGHWDSDALLMSYLSPDKGADDDGSDEGPEGPQTPAGAVHSFHIDQDPSHGTPSLVMTPGGIQGNIWGYEAESPGSQDAWFRNQQNESSLDDSAITALALREEDERRKFEWLIPEHLPNSVLCPLHPSYNGYSKGVCYWHVRKKSKEGSKSEKGEGSSIGHRQAEGWNGHKSTKPATQRGSIGRGVGKVGPTRLVKKRRLESLWGP